MKVNPFVKQLGEYFGTYLPDIQGVSKNTIMTYADSFAIFYRFIYETKSLQHTKITFKMFTSPLFDDYILWLRNKRNYSESTIRGRLTAIVSFLKYASKREMSALKAYSSAVAIERPNIQQTEFPYFTLEEMRILLSLPNPDKYLGKRDLVLLSFLYETGSRAQEVCDVKVGDVRFGSPTKIKLHGKGNKVREVPISDEVSKLLKYHLKENQMDVKEHRNRPLFSSQTNEQMTTSCIRSIVIKYVNIAKKENPELFLENNYSPHSFRHSKAIHMVESGINLIYIRNFLGHTSISSTEIYARVGQEAVTKALTERKIPNVAKTVPDRTESQFTIPDCIKKSQKLCE